MPRTARSRSAGTYATGGLGTGAGLGSQGAVTLSDNGKHLFAVNAGSNSISEFSVKKDWLRLEATFSSNGVLPISVTASKNLLYVLNAGSSTITGFKIDGNGRVESIAGSTQPLLGTAPAQVAFSPNGAELVVTEKGSGTLDTYAVRGGRAQPGVSSPSAGATPFGFAFDSLGRAFVSEAAGSASSYAIDAVGRARDQRRRRDAPGCAVLARRHDRTAASRTPRTRAAATISGFSIAATARSRFSTRPARRPRSGRAPIRSTRP